MISCPSCAAEQSDTSKFCSECGTALASGYAATVTRAGGPTDDAGSSSSHSSLHGRFLPGTKLAGRYRIVSLLGKGGMGEVYRADDLRLGQTVALKFLPPKLAREPQRLERFQAEVRLTRQISHPNVCRVYDMDEVDGHHFLSMEFIDGEDLRVLLRRIGRVPKDKGIQIAQELCAGLAAAHEKGVLHRDLKPANIMIDGRGQVRITDFGLAKLVEDAHKNEIAGTPAYMAPEQLHHGQTTIQSDLYSLGLILYEMFTGEAVNKSVSIPELLQRQENSSPSAPSHIVDDMDPVVERVILRCLEKAAPERPKSARAVASSLPGADPLSAALAAGETPSPEMVAAAGEESGLTPRLAAIAMISTLVSLLVNSWLADSTSLVNLADLRYQPSVLAVKAGELLRDDLGYHEPPGDTTHGFLFDDGPLRFWYRQRTGIPFLMRSLHTLDGEPIRARPTFDLPPWEFPQELGLKLDLGGRLHFFRARPPAVTDAREARTDASSLPWTDWFRPETTGVYLASTDTAVGVGGSATTSAPVLKPVMDRRRTPPDAFDATGVWTGVNEELERVYVVAAAFRGKPVYFEVFNADEYERPWKPPSVNLGFRIWHGLIALGALAGAALTWRNLRSGRGDRRGAIRLGSCVLLVSGGSWISLTHSLGTLSLGLAQALLTAGLLWTLYIAFEPIIRRSWPDSLISWTRLLGGRVRDPIVGRDVLIGTVSGVGISILFSVNRLAHMRLLDLNLNPKFMDVSPLSLVGPRQLLGQALECHLWGVFIAANLLVSLLLFRIVFRLQWLALGTWYALLTVFLILATNSSFLIGCLPLGLIIASHHLLLARFGLLALVVQMTAFALATSFPLTLNTDHWYFSHGMFAIAWISVVALYGFYLLLGGRSVFAASEENS